MFDKTLEEEIADITDIKYFNVINDERPTAKRHVGIVGRLVCVNAYSLGHSQ